MRTVGEIWALIGFSVCAHLADDVMTACDTR